MLVKKSIAGDTQIRYDFCQPNTNNQYEHTMKHLRFALLLITAALCGCVYHQPFQQGNILTPSKMQAIHNGMTSEAVVAKLGSPVLQNMYADNRMNYVYTQQPTRHKTMVKRMVIQFQNDRVVDVSTI